MIFSLLEPVTPGPFTSDLVRDHLYRDFPGASPTSTREASVQRKELFHPLFHGHYQEYGWHLVNSQPGWLCRLFRTIHFTRFASQPTHTAWSDDREPCHRRGATRTSAAKEKRPTRFPRCRDTTKTKILAGILAELRARQAQLTAPAANQAEPTADPNFNWPRLVLPAETNFQVPTDG